MKVSTYKDIIAWQKAHELVKEVYKITQTFPKEEKFGLVSQIRRAGISVTSNIVEGFSRRGVRESIQFYNHAFASLKEVEYQSLLSYELKFIQEREYIFLNNLIEEVSKLLFCWIKSHKEK